MRKTVPTVDVAELVGDLLVGTSLGRQLDGAGVAGGSEGSLAVPAAHGDGPRGGS